MSMFYYISSSKELKRESYGQVEVFSNVKEGESPKHIMFQESEESSQESKKRQVEISDLEEGTVIYKNWIDATGIHIGSKVKDKEILQHFTQEYVYTLFGHFPFRDIDDIERCIPINETQKKSLNSLFEYANLKLERGDFFEVLACWAGTEYKAYEGPVETIINVSKEKYPENFCLYNNRVIKLIKE